MDKILIIEDEELIREELKTLLSNAGYLVEAAEVRRYQKLFRYAHPVSDRTGYVHG